VVGSDRANRAADKKLRPVHVPALCTAIHVARKYKNPPAFRSPKYQYDSQPALFVGRELRLARVQDLAFWFEAQVIEAVAQNRAVLRDLFGQWSVQLLFECSRTDGLAVCTSCGTPFLPAARRAAAGSQRVLLPSRAEGGSGRCATWYRQTAKYRATYDKRLKNRRKSSI
jgi:hypothetical protein